MVPEALGLRENLGIQEIFWKEKRRSREGLLEISGFFTPKPDAKKNF